MSADTSVPGAAGTHVLIVDDDENICRLLKAYLEKDGYQVQSAYDGASACALFADWRPDVVVLDLMLPEIDGREVCRRLRAVSDVPILMLTALDQEEDVVYGLDLGADDYVAKPFSLREVAVRIKVILRRSRGTELASGSVITAGQLHIDHTRHKAAYAGRDLRLTAMEFRLLSLLAANPDQPFSRRQILEQVQGGENAGDERGVDAHIKNLRHKLDAAAGSHQYIQTVYGVGYLFSGE